LSQISKFVPLKLNNLHQAASIFFSAQIYYIFKPVAATSVQAHPKSLQQCNMYTVAHLFLLYSDYDIHSHTISTTCSSLFTMKHWVWINFMQCLQYLWLGSQK